MCNSQLFQIWAPEYINADCPLAEFISGVIEILFFTDLVSYE